MEKKKGFKEIFFHNFVIVTFVLLYAIVSIISTIHVINFFELSNPHWLAVSLAIAFEVGAAASLSSIIVLNKVDKRLVWFLFVLLTGMQAMGNTYYAYTNLEDYKNWIELFGLLDMEVIAQKRILSIVSGAILPIVALGFIKSLVDYMKPDIEIEESINIDNSPKKQELVFEKVEKIEKPKKEEVKEETKEEFIEKIIDEFIEEEKSKEESVPEVKEEPIPEVKDEKEEKPKNNEKKLEANQEEKPTDFEQELDALKHQLEEEKKKTKFEKELDDLRNQIHNEKEKNVALKLKRENDKKDKKEQEEKEIEQENKKKEKIKKEIEKDLNKDNIEKTDNKIEVIEDNPKQTNVKEIRVKPIVKRNPNPTRPL